MKMMKTADFLSLSLSFCSTVLSVGRPSGLRPPVIGVSSLIWAGLLWRACPVGCRWSDTVRCYLSGPPDSSATAGGSPAGERGGATRTHR